MKENETQRSNTFGRIINIFRHIEYPEVFENQRSILLNLSLLFGIFSGLVAAVVLIVIPNTRVALIPLTAVVILFGLSYVAYKYGQLMLSAWGTNIALYTVVTSAVAFSLVDLSSAGIISFASLIIIAGLTLSNWYAIVFAILSSLTIWLITYARQQGILASNNPNDLIPYFNLGIVTVNYLFLGILLRLATRSNWQTQVELRDANAAEKRIRGTLQSLVNDRTRDLQIAAQVGSQISQIQELDDLLANAVNVIKEEFGLYHAQIYLADATGRNLALKASSGDVGRKLIQQGHRLAIGLDSINGTAAQTRQTKLVEDTRATNSIAKANSFLPDTRSELSIPMISNEQLVGVLNLQSAEVSGLSENNISVFDTVAAQLAVSIDNANLFVQLQKTQEMVTAQAQRLVRSGWRTFLSSIEKGDQIRYTYNLSDVVPRQDSNDESYREQKYTVPIDVSGTQVGIIQVEQDQDSSWSVDDEELVKSIAEQVAQKVENLRLLNDANRYREEAETSLRKLTRDNWQSYLQNVEDEKLGYVYDGENLVSAQNTADEQRQKRKKLQKLTIQGEEIGDISIGESEVEGTAAEEVLTAVAQSLSTHIETLRLAEQTEQRVVELDIINQINDVVKEQTDLDSLIHQVGRVIKRAFAANYVTIGLLNQTQNLIDFPCIFGDGPDGEPMVIQADPIPQGEGLNWRIVKEKKPLLIGSYSIPNAKKDGAKAPYYDKQQHAGSEFSFLGVPLTTGFDVLGVITLQNDKRNRSFTEADRDLLITLGASVGVGVRNAQLFQQTQDILAETENLYTASVAFNRAQSLRDIIESFINGLGDKANASGAAYWNLSSDENQRITTMSLVDSWRPGNQKERLPIGSTLDASIMPTIRRWTADPREIALIDDLKSEESAKDDKFLLNLAASIGIQSMAVVPMTLGSRWIGMITFQWDEPNKFTQQDRRVITSLAAQAATAFDSLTQLETTKKRANRETLVNNITQRIQETVTVDKALQTTVEELGKALQLRKARIRLRREHQENGGPAN